jgi:acetylornithine/N-succinyldiaminopimelate aminotransferase
MKLNLLKRKKTLMNDNNPLLTDPRIQQAKKLILETIKQHQEQIQGVKPPDPAKKAAYDKMISTFNEYRGGKLAFSYVGSGLGKGALVELLDGSVKYDFINGIGPHCYGHSHASVISSSIDAALSDTVMQGNLQQNKDAFDLIEMLIKVSGLDHCFLTTTGAMANENGLKIAFQKNFPASRILSFDHCFAGRTWTASQITDKPSFREGLPINVFVDYIPYYDISKPEESTKEALQALKKAIERYPKQHAVMCFELVQGEGGFYYGTAEFFKAIMSVLRENGITILIDEVQTFGRLQELFAFQFFGLEEFADIVTIGKVAQVGATLFRKELCPLPGLLSQTFTSSTSAIQASKVIIQELLNGGYYGPQGKNQQMHTYFVNHLQQLSKQYPQLIQGPFGIGSMIAFTPLGGNQKHVNAFIQSLFEAGVMSFVAGSNPTRTRMLLPIMAITKEDIDEVCKLIEKTLLIENEKLKQKPFL